MIQRNVPRFSRIVAPLVLVCCLAFVLVPSVAAAPRSPAATLIGPKAYYLALGDSLAFGFQPDLDFTHGYTDDFYSNLQSHGVSHYANMACPGETSSSMINGGCSGVLRKYPYIEPQLQAAVEYLQAHAGQVSPVTLDIGVNDLLGDLNTSTCAVSSNLSNDLATMDNNIRHTILPQLVAAMTVNGKVTGDLFLLNYYDPFANICPNTVALAETLNQHLAADASGYATVVDIFDPFGGAATPNPDICTYTWMCSFPITSLAIHATTTGYQVMAKAIEQTAGY